MSEPLSPRQRFPANRVMKPAEAQTGETVSLQRSFTNTSPPSPPSRPAEVKSHSRDDLFWASGTRVSSFLLLPGHRASLLHSIPSSPDLFLQPDHPQ